MTPKNTSRLQFYPLKILLAPLSVYMGSHPPGLHPYLLVIKVDQNKFKKKQPLPLAEALLAFLSLTHSFFVSKTRPVRNLGT